MEDLVCEINKLMHRFEKETDQIIQIQKNLRYELTSLLNSRESKESSSSSDLINQFYNRKVRQQKIEETHSKRTFYIENKLLLKLDELCKDEKGKQINGMKTYIINRAIWNLLEK